MIKIISKYLVRNTVQHINKLLIIADINDLKLSIQNQNPKFPKTISEQIQPKIT